MARIRKSLPDDIRRETKFFIEPFLNKEDGLLYYIDTRGFLIPLSQGDGSIYVADGTLLGDRTLTGAANFLHFNSLSNFTVGTTGDINLDPGGEVAVGAGKSISFDQTALGANVTAIECRSNPRTQIAFVASGPADTPNELWINADTDVYLAPDSGNTIFNKNLAFYTASGGEIADINTASGKVLVSKEWVAATHGGTVTSVDSGGSVNGVFLTGGPITSSGTISISGTLAINNSDWSGTDLSIANGGTGQSTAQTAINALTDAASGSNGDLLTIVTGNAQWAAPSFAGSSIYTGSGTVPTTTVATITDTLNFDGGRVGINVAPTTNDFVVD